MAGQTRVAGFKALDQGNLKSAETEFESALAKAPSDADTLGGLGIVRLREGRFEEARDLLSQASAKGSADRWAEALAAATYYARVNESRNALEGGDTATALAIAQDLARQNSGDRSVALGLMADILEKQGRYAEAAQASGQALQASGIEQGFADQLELNQIRQQALAAAQSGNISTAEQLFKSGIASNPGEPWIRYEYARFLLGRDRDYEAYSQLETLSASNQSESLYAAALLSEQMDDLSKAGQLMDRIPANLRTQEMQSYVIGLSAQTAISRARVLDSQGKRVQALAGLNQIIATGRIPPAQQAQIASVLYELGDRESATTLAQSLLAQGLENAADYEPIVRILAGSGQSAFAYGAVQQASERAPNTVEGQALIAKLKRLVSTAVADQLREAGQYAEAYDVLQTAWQQAPGDTDILMSLARLYQAGDMSVQASQTFQIVLQKDPEDEGALIGLVDTASASGDMRLAKTAMSQALKVAPENYEVYLAGARMEEIDGDEKSSRRYLEKARELYLAQNGNMAGGFSSNNPFASRSVAGGPFASPAAPVNPFDPVALASANRPASRTPFSNDFASPQPTTAGGFQTGTSRASSSPFGASQPSVLNADPILAGIAQDLDALEDETGTRVDVSTGYRDRSGEAGLSGLSELSGSAEVSTGFAGGRISAKAHAVSVDAGEADVNSLLKFGRNGLLQARGIIAEAEAELADPGAQHEAGVELSAGFKNDWFGVDVGTTPLGFEEVQMQGGLEFTPRLSRYASARLWFERRPVTDSVVSYAGATDPVTGEFWGAVMQTGGGLSAAYERNGTGVYADASYYDYAGTNVRSNGRVQLNAGGYLVAYEDNNSTFRLGVNGNFQQFDNNQNVFTYGQGGYFSPQNFLSVSFPVSYTYKIDRLEAGASITPGYQSYEQDTEPFFPTDPVAQAELVALRALDTDVQAFHAGSSQTGFGINLGGTAYYEITPGTRIGGEFSLDTFGEYNEIRTMLGIRQNFGASE